MPTAEIDGTTIAYEAYEVVGDDGPPWVVTPEVD
jgi:hypothetical protein